MPEIKLSPTTQKQREFVSTWNRLRDSTKVAEHYGRGAQSMRNYAAWLRQRGWPVVDLRHPKEFPSNAAFLVAWNAADSVRQATDMLAGDEYEIDEKYVANRASRLRKYGLPVKYMPRLQGSRA